MQPIHASAAGLRARAAWQCGPSCPLVPHETRQHQPRRPIRLTPCPLGVLNRSAPTIATHNRSAFSMRNAPAGSLVMRAFYANQVPAAAHWRANRDGFAGCDDALASILWVDIARGDDRARRRQAGSAHTRPAPSLAPLAAAILGADRRDAPGLLKKHAHFADRPQGLDRHVGRLVFNRLHSPGRVAPCRLHNCPLDRANRSVPMRLARRRPRLVPRMGDREPPITTAVRLPLEGEGGAGPRLAVRR